MRIQKIYAQPSKIQNFKAYDDSYNYDFGTEYNTMSIKDAIVFSSVLSGIIGLFCVLLSHEDKIKNLIKKGKNKLNHFA